LSALIFGIPPITGDIDDDEAKGDAKGEDEEDEIGWLKKTIKRIFGISDNDKRDDTVKKP